MMDQTLLTSLPTDIITNILSRLPVRTIVSCQCVCKSWCELVKTPEFAKSHLSKSESGLIFYEHGRLPELLRIFEFEDEVELDQHEPSYAPVAKFQMPFLRDGVGAESSGNGLLLLRNNRAGPHTLYICNPITSEYINLPYPPERKFHFPSLMMYGFGVSKMTDQYKVVRIFQECEEYQDPQRAECQVYTLGKGSWRSVPHYHSLSYCDSVGAFVKGNLHWLVTDIEETQFISCFDLETEVFKTYSPPPPYLEECRYCFGTLAVLGDCLSFCDNSSENEIVIWVMKEYGVEKSWTKDFVISKVPWFADDECYDMVHPFKVLRNGDILMLSNMDSMLYYSNKTKTTLRVMFELRDLTWVAARLHVSSFISLKTFAMENVVKF